MNRHLNAIAGRLSLRPPQRRALEILDRITEIASPGKDAPTITMLSVIQAEFPSVSDFEREFPSLCFALATGVGKLIHAQMQENYWEEASEYEVRVHKGYTELKPSAYTYSVAEPLIDYRVSPPDKSNMTKYLFGGFERCLYPAQKFDSEAERKLAVILERDSIKWFRPARGQFQIFYRAGADHLEYQPDFVAEAADEIFMLELKASDEMEDPIVLAKREAAIGWCANASTHAQRFGNKRWRYVMIPHDEIQTNITLEALAARFGQSGRLAS